MGDRLDRIAQLKPAMYLRSIAGIFMDVSLNPHLASAILSRIRSFNYGYAERILDASNGKVDIVLTGDDFGSQAGPLVSPQMWTQFLGEGFARFIEIA